jgi:isopenicillin N synthase-like dioxygenase
MRESRTIASVSLEAAISDPRTFAAELGASFELYGFAIVSNHGIPADLIARADEAARALFALPERVKCGYYREGIGGARGYTPFGVETAKGATEQDLKEFWHVGRDLPGGHSFARTMLPNVWPDEVAGFRETFLALFRAFDRAGGRILEAVASHLGLAAGYFEDKVADGNSVLRLLHYPPLPIEAQGARAGAHEDINAITLLLGAEEAGLELLDRAGRWRPVSPREGEMVVNIGDMLERLTNGLLPSTSHRVVNPPPDRRGRPRYSMPFFLHFRPDFLIETLRECVLPDRPNLFPEPITADAFLQQRLQEIKLA